jgi:hypothetical protein
MHRENEALDPGGLSAVEPSPARHADTAAGRKDLMQREPHRAGPCAMLDRTALPPGRCGARESKKDSTRMNSGCTQSTRMGLKLALDLHGDHRPAGPDGSSTGAVVSVPSACSASIRLHLRKTLLASLRAARCHAPSQGVPQTRTPCTCTDRHAPTGRPGRAASQSFVIRHQNPMHQFGAAPATCGLAPVGKTPCTRPHLCCRPRSGRSVPWRGRTPCTRTELRSCPRFVSPTGKRDVGETAPRPSVPVRPALRSCPLAG